MEYDPAWLLTGEGDPRRSSLPVPVKVDALQAQIADLERQLAEVEEARERDLNRIEFESERLADIEPSSAPLSACPSTTFRSMRHHLDPGANYEDLDASVGYEDAYLDWLEHSAASTRAALFSRCAARR